MSQTAAANTASEHHALRVVGERLFASSDWREHAACVGLDTMMFFDPSQEARAKAVCADCPVRQDCLSSALSVSAGDTPLEGVWGGLNQIERRRARRRLARTRRSP